VAAIAQGLVLALPTPTELDERTPVEIKFPAVLVEQLEITFDMDASVALHGHSCWHSGSP
jgi:hypothetical protein